MDYIIKRPMLCIATLAVITLIYLTITTSEQFTLPDLLAFEIVSFLAFLSLISLIADDGSLRIDMAYPSSLYGLFYLFYYLLPYLILFFTGQLPENMELVIASLFLVGYLGWQIGTKGLPQSQDGIKLDRINRREAQVLLALCTTGIGLVVYFYAGRIEEGIFFNQARFIEQELTVAGSISFVFSQQIQLPIILLLGLLSAVRHEDIAKISRIILISYGIGISVILVLSSQTRPAITAMLFLIIAMRLYRKGATKIWHIALVSIFCLLAVIVVQGHRIVSVDEFANAPNQLSFAIENTIPDTLDMIRDYRTELGERLLSRGGGGISFLAEVVRAIEDRGSFFYGQGVIESLYGLIPRFVWLEKPEVIPPQLVAQNLLHFPLLYDASLGPVTQFYFEGGWIGVVVGYIIFGWAMVWLTNRTIQSQNVGLWIALCFIWGYVSNLEQELILGILGTLRTAFLVYLLWRLIVFIIGDENRGATSRCR